MDHNTSDNQIQRHQLYSISTLVHLNGLGKKLRKADLEAYLNRRERSVLPLVLELQVQGPQRNGYSTTSLNRQEPLTRCD